MNGRHFVTALAVALWMAAVPTPADAGPIPGEESETGPVDDLGPVDELGPVEETGPVDERGPVDEPAAADAQNLDAGRSGPTEGSEQKAKSPIPETEATGSDALKATTSDQAEPTAADEDPQAVKPPELITFNEAKLPGELDIPDGDYTVVLTLTIDETGRVTEVEPVSADRPELSGPAETAARAFVFKPAVYQGNPVLVQVRYDYQFQVRRKVRNVVQIFLTVEKGTRDSISDVTGVIEETGATFTAIDGRMEVSNLRPGTYTLYIPVGQYEEVRKEFKIRTDGKEAPTDTLFLKKAYGARANQTIIRAPREARFAAKQTLSAGELVSFPGSGGDVLKAVENLPGIARSTFGIGTLVVYGSPPLDTKIYYNSMPFISLYHFGGLYSVINSEFIDSIDFVPAAFDASYGRAIGGVVNVKLKDEPLTGIHGAVDVNLLHAGAVIGGPYSKDGDIQAAFRRSYYDAIIAALPLGDTGIDVATAPRYYDYQFRLQHRFGTEHKLTFFFNGTDDRVELINYKNDVNPTFVGSAYGALWSHSMQADWKWDPKAGVSNDLRVQASINEMNFNVFGQIIMVTRDYPVFIRDDLSIRAHDKVTVRAGLDSMFDPFTYDLSVPQMGTDGGQMTPIESSERVSVTGEGLMVGMAPWVSVEWKPVSILTIVPSLRADFYLGSWQAWTIDPRLSMTVDAIPDKLSVRMAGGLYSQPAPSFAFIEGYGNPDIEPEYGAHALAGVRYNPIDRLTIDVNGFFKYFWNRVQLSEDGTLNYDNGAVGRAYGFDFLLRMNPGGSIPLTGWIAYTFVRSELFDPKVGSWRPSDFQQEHNLNVFVSYKLPKNWTIGARFRLTSGYPYTENTGYVYDSDKDRYISVPSDDINSKTLPLFHQLDIRVDKEWVFNAWKLGLYLEVQNVYLNKNPEGTVSNYDYSKTGYLTGIPILPVLGIKGSF